METLAEGIAPGFRTIAWILAPQEIVIGGALAAIGAPLIDALGRRLYMDGRPIEARLRTSASSEQAVIGGAIQAALAIVQNALFSSDDLSTAPLRAATPAVSAGS